MYKLGYGRNCARHSDRALLILGTQARRGVRQLRKAIPATECRGRNNSRQDQQ